MEASRDNTQGEQRNAIARHRPPAIPDIVHRITTLQCDTVAISIYALNNGLLTSASCSHAVLSSNAASASWRLAARKRRTWSSHAVCILNDVFQIVK